MRRRHLLKSERDIWITASSEVTPMHGDCAKPMTCSGLPVSSACTPTCKLRSTKYERLLSMAAIVTTTVVLNSTCSRHASDSLVSLVHGFGILVVFANRLSRFHSDPDWTNTVTGRSRNAGLAMQPLIIFAV